MLHYESGDSEEERWGGRTKKSAIWDRSWDVILLTCMSVNVKFGNACVCFLTPGFHINSFFFLGISDHVFLLPYVHTYGGQAANSGDNTYALQIVQIIIYIL